MIFELQVVEDKETFHQRDMIFELSIRIVDKNLSLKLDFRYAIGKTLLFI